MENDIKISRYTTITNIEKVINAMSKIDERIEDAEQILCELRKQIENESTFNDIQDLLYNMAITFYAKGIKIGSRFEEAKGQ